MIYLDNAATTKINKEVLNCMMPYLTDNYGNPSALYKVGRNNKEAIEKARKQVASAIGTKPNEIYFTSGGSESNNLAINGVCEQQKQKGRNKIITSNIEHPSVLNVCKHLEQNGFEVTYVSVNKKGFVNVDQIKSAIDDKTAIVSIMYANNEIGTIQSVSDIGTICKEHGVPFHVDAVQAVGNIEIDLSKNNIDLMSISGHKIHAPKGVGCLYIKNGIECSPLIYGGGQENGLRSGTENVANIVGFGKAMEIATSYIHIKTDKIKYLRNYFISSIVDNNYIKLNGGLYNRLCGNVNMSFKNCEGESIALQLSSYDICVSAKSACNSKSLEPSHVIKAIEDDEDYLYGAVRFSIGEHNTKAEIDYVINAIKKILLLQMK